MSNEVCGDNRFEIIEKAKQDLLKSTNIQTSEDEMQVIDNILFRCWQMGWLEKYNQPKTDWIPCEERLPSETMLCLVTVENRMQKNPIIMWWIDGKEEQVSMFDDKKGHWKEQWCKVIAWQPLPQPYKKEGAENEK